MFGKPVRMIIGGIAALGVAAGSPFVVAEATNTDVAVVETVQEVFHPGGPQQRGQKFDMRMDEYLADALGITLDELQAAKVEARTNMITDAVEEGNLTQEQADLMLARIALADYIDRAELTAGVLGITVEELETAREEGTRLDALIEEAGFTPEEFREAMQAAFEDAINQAVEEGVITAEQAELILSQAQNRGPGNGPGGRGGGPGNGPGGPGGGPGNGPGGQPGNPPAEPGT